MHLKIENFNNLLTFTCWILPYKHLYCMYMNLYFIKYNTVAIVKTINMEGHLQFKCRRIMSRGSLFQYVECHHWAHISLGSSLLGSLSYWAHFIVPRTVCINGQTIMTLINSALQHKNMFIY